MISRGQFKRLADIINTGGGFSRKVTGPLQGQFATDAYMVGMPGYGKDFPPDEPVKGKQLHRFAQQESAVLGQPDVYLGGVAGL